MRLRGFMDEVRGYCGDAAGTLVSEFEVYLIAADHARCETGEERLRVGGLGLEAAGNAGLDGIARGCIGGCASCYWTAPWAEVCHVGVHDCSRRK